MTSHAMETVLVTGASTGIGHATVLEFARRGYRVFASARRAESVAQLDREGRANGFDVVSLDVEDDGSVERAVAEVHARAGGLDVLVNNAGYGLIAPVETVTVAALRSQFETNVIGTHRMVRAVLPGMRARGHGTIVQLSSVMGRVVMPLYGAYSASKFALEAMSDALRLEVAPFGIRVVLIEPGPIRTEFSRTSHQASDASRDDTRGAPYADLIEAMSAARERSRRAVGLGPEAVATTIADAVASKSPNARYAVTAFAKVMPTVQNVLPRRVFDGLVRFSMRRR